MKIYAQFTSPTLAPAFPDDYQEFDSIRAAKVAFERFVDSESRFCNERECQGLLFAGHPEACNGYPEKILTVGPRGGIRMTNG